MAIDYTKRPKAGAPVVLTKQAPAVSLTKVTSGGQLRVNLNWTARPAAPHGLFHKPPAPLDLDLGCLYEFSDGSKGVVQALGNAFRASPKGVTTPVIRLDGDDRSGSAADGENLYIDLAHLAEIRRVLVFALIYEGAANWAAASGVVTLYPASSATITIHLDEARDGARICAIAQLLNQNGTLVVQREVNYIDGAQRALDAAYSWGMTWRAGRK